MTKSTKEKILEKYFNSLGYTLVEIKDSVFREEKSTFVFQTDNKNHTVDCSTILYDHAVKIYQAIAEERERVRGMKHCRFGCYCKTCGLCDAETMIHCGDCVMNKPISLLSFLDTNPK